MKFSNTYGVVLLGLLCALGCSKEEDTSVAPPPAAAPGAKPAQMNVTAPTTPPPAPDAPPPAANTAALAAPAEDPNAKVELKSIDGKTLSAMEYVESMAAAYERTRAGQNDPNETPWPPLTDLSQLVARKFITRLPAAPAGQKFVYNPQTGKVSLAPQ